MWAGSVWEKSYGCKERLTPHLSPNACPCREKVGLQTGRTHLGDVTAFLFIELVLAAQPVLGRCALSTAGAAFGAVVGAIQDFPLRLFLRWNPCT